MAAAYKAMTLVRFTGQAEPLGFIFHPNDWQDVVLSQESTGPFLWGHPSAVPMVRLWGLPVAVSTGATENTAICADFANFTRVDERRGISVQIGYINAQFTEGEITLRADLRVAFTVPRPAAVCTITGI
jgi:HK97 family phage major capsid protein